MRLNWLLDMSKTRSRNADYPLHFPMVMFEMQDAASVSHSEFSLSHPERSSPEQIQTRDGGVDTLALYPFTTPLFAQIFRLLFSF